MKAFTLTAKEMKALKVLVCSSNKVCSSGCVYPHMAKSKKQCDECDYTLAINSVEDKLFED